jgi:hypothetical protein
MYSARAWSERIASYTYDSSDSGDEEEPSSEYFSDNYFPSAVEELNIRPDLVPVNNPRFDFDMLKLENKKFFYFSSETELKSHNRRIQAELTKLRRHRFEESCLLVQRRNQLTELVTSSLNYRETNQSFLFKVFDEKRVLLKMELEALFVEESIMMLKTYIFKPRQRRRFVNTEVLDKRLRKLNSLYRKYPE